MSHTKRHCKWLKVWITIWKKSVIWIGNTGSAFNTGPQRTVIVGCRKRQKNVQVAKILVERMLVPDLAGLIRIHSTFDLLGKSVQTLYRNRYVSLGCSVSNHFHYPMGPKSLNSPTSMTLCGGSQIWNILSVCCLDFDAQQRSGWISVKDLILGHLVCFRCLVEFIQFPWL